MNEHMDITISQAIAQTWHERLADRLESDVVFVGAGPAGMVGAMYLARDGFKVTMLEKRLAPGGGIWGGGMGMSQVVVQDEALPILDETGVRHTPWQGCLHTADAIELAVCLGQAAIHAGVEIFNLTTVEDVYVLDERVAGVVINRTGISGVIHVDPITMYGRATVDGTGHEAIVVAALKKHGLLDTSQTIDTYGEGPMNARAGEAFTVEKVCEIYPGLWLTGMSVCATLGGSRMGPICGGMLLSGQRLASQLAASLRG